MVTTTPEIAAKLVSTASERRRIAAIKRQPFVDAGWERFRSDVFTFVSGMKVFVSYSAEDDQFELLILTDPMVRERFGSADEALDWFEALKVAVDFED